MKLTRTHIFQTKEKLSLSMLREVVEKTADLPLDSKVAIREDHGNQRDPFYEVTITVTES